MALDYPDKRDAPPQPSRSAGTSPADANSAGTQTPTAQGDRASRLRAMVAARVAAPRPTAEAMRDAIARAADAVKGLGRSRGRDNGAEC